MVQYYGATKEQAIRSAVRDGWKRSELRAEKYGPKDWVVFGDYNKYFKRKKDPRYVPPVRKKTKALNATERLGREFLGFR